MLGLFDHQFPYTDFHELNLDWIMAQIKNLTDKVNHIYDDAAAEIIAKYINQLLPDAVYDEEHERLILYVEPTISADGEHIYNPDTESITITDAQ